MTYEEFKKEYTTLVTRLLNYKPGTIGVQELAEKCRQLMDEYPEWTEQVESEWETEKESTND